MKRDRAPAVGQENRIFANYVPLEDLDELESLASLLNREYMPKTGYGRWICSVDKKKRRLRFDFEVTFKAEIITFLLGYDDIRAGMSSSVYASLAAELTHALEHAEEDLGVRFEIDEQVSKWWILFQRATPFWDKYMPWTYGTVYYRVLRREDRLASSQDFRMKVDEGGSLGAKNQSRKDQGIEDEEEWTIDDILG